ncbi:6-phosphogluconolactonase [Chryseobacterium sp. MEBOG06]|uniref:6-phosphogluconolactonase n=1 Tax=unclassified Chryseobacterium TaxID=2593645 RepID=UPI001F0204CA|nr:MULTISPECIES: 6-phosphogluconolactonase [unclassified Chryseobacterium]UKB86049.1 6-phosphogluconolactonase [Chryseobacterium sp. MEBOG06]
MNDLKIFGDAEELINALAETICEASQKAVRSHGQFNFVLSGGSSPKKLYELLASEKFKDKIDWEKTFFFFGDERFLPENDPDRNSRMVQEALFDPLGINTSHIFKVDTSHGPEAAAERYMESIKVHFDKKPIVFDFILLGLGDNSHTASLFPYTSVLKETEATVKSIFVDEVDMFRITMTAPLINQAEQIAFLVFGEGKSEAVVHILEDRSGSIDEYPARLIKSDKNKVQWFLDSSAASKIVENQD